LRLRGIIKENAVVGSEGVVYDEVVEVIMLQRN
jgi:hypothetical protein